MGEAVAATLLTRWANFYVVTGSSAAGLTGLQFVVLALVERFRPRNLTEGIDAFSTPNIVYFSTVLLLSAALCAPWNGLFTIGFLVAACGAAGVVYAWLVARRARRQTAYQLVLEDWLWHIAFPLTAHTMLLVAGLALVRHPRSALFTIAAATLFLLFIGIHNAWDTVIYVVTQGPQSDRDDEERREPPPG